jgi:ubiquinone/menaquinone biosynthesis C-methylase UbiE
VNADPIARLYRLLEHAAFGRSLERCRFRFLREAAGAQCALLLGDGDGRFLKRLLEAAPQAAVETIDSSRAMLKLAQTRCGGSALVHRKIVYRNDDVRTCDLPRSKFDLIATHFFLDCFSEADMRAVVLRVAAAAAPEATWIISEFRQQTWWSRVVVRGLYFFFRLTTGLRVRTLADHRPMLQAAGFVLQQEETSLGALLAAELWVRR